MDAAASGSANDLSAGADVAPEYNLRLVWTLSRYLHEKLGAHVLEEVATEAGLTAAAFESQTRWVSGEQFERVLAAARARFRSDEEFIQACRYRIAEVYGPFRFITWATSPALVFRGSEKASKFCSSVGRFEVVETGPTHARIKWISPRRESRLMCLSRQAQCCVAPTLWGLPPAEVTEHSCVSRGDPACDYTFRWYSKRRVLPVLVAGICGLLVARMLAMPSSFAPVLTGLLAASCVLLYEYRRSSQLNTNVQIQASDALREVLTEEAEARREIELLNHRQREWTRLLEENATRRVEQTKQLIEALSTQHEAQAERLRGVSHDLKGPLSVVLAGVHYLREQGVEPDVLKELEIATYRMNDLATSLIQSATVGSISRFNPSTIRTDELTASFGRRLRALALGRDIRVSSFKTRECPASIELDPIILDRIVDNLITNAIKYTAQGSIVCELDGAPGFLVIKLSDTGRGIAEQDIEKTFRPGGSVQDERAANSHGLGLSVVLQLLSEIGGRMEVMSKVASGTTFWVHVPVKAAGIPAESVGNLPASPPPKLAPVLTIRRRAS